MPDVFSKEKRSEIMSLIRSKNTKPEIKLRKLTSSYFYPLGERYRIHYKKIPGKPDLVFVSKKIAVFVDGTFWHGYNFKEKGHKLPKIYWQEKIQRNIERDRETNKKLRKMGWKVIRIWEHTLNKEPEKVLNLLKKEIL